MDMAMAMDAYIQMIKMKRLKIIKRSLSYI